MTSPPQPKTRTRTRSRRLSACPRHPSQPITGFCPLCLHERLSGLESPSKPSTSASTSQSELRRTKSVSIRNFDASSFEPRRHSCDVRGKNTLSHLFNVDDECKLPSREIRVESKSLVRNVNVDCIGNDEILENVSDVRVCNDEIDEDVMTMKEHIDLELRSGGKVKKDFNSVAGSFRVVASVFSKKLNKWRVKSRKKGSCGEREDGGGEGGRVIGRETVSEVGEYGLGRRSCDTEPTRFSVDGNRISVDDVRFSFDEPRASWDGYLIARTIPRLTPMLSGVENMMLSRPEEQMGSIREDDKDEMTSGLSAQSNSDSSSSRRQSSFDRTSSIRSGSLKGVGLQGDEAKVVANSNVFGGSKLVITEKELKDWHLNSIKGDQSRKSIDSVPKDCSVDTLIGFKKLTKWKMAGSKWGFKSKLGDKKTETLVENKSHVVEPPYKEENREVGVENGGYSSMLARSSSCVTSRNPCKPVATDDGMGAKELVLDRNRSTKYTSSNFDNGLLRFYLTPFRSYRSSRSGKGRLKNSSPAIAGEVLRLN
ncbi:hypothetical protein AgCh_003981 [Apium graveolens]